MTAEWMGTTADFLAANGWEVERLDTEDDAFVRTRYDIRGGDREHLVLEALTYPDGDERYWLQLVSWHGLRSYPFPLDSWKHRDAFVEFKFHVEPVTGLGLSFFVDLPRHDRDPPQPS